MARIIKIFKALFHIILYVIISFFLHEESVKPKILVHRFLPDIKHILLWSKIPALVKEGQTAFIEKQCKNINCYVTTNRKFFGDVRYFDAIIFNAQEVSRQDWDLPRYRGKYQKYVFAAFDPADKVPICSPVYSNFFNWTWTYRLASTIPYKMITVDELHNVIIGKKSKWMFIKHMKPITETFKKSLQTKSKMAAIYLNECTSINKREVFLKKLQQELLKYNQTVDVFGNCGSIKYDKRGLDYRLKKTYYFYLALESSFAPDYVTDSVLNGYNNNAIPVVYGGANYERFLPTSSYVDASYMTSTELAKIMIEIIQNKEKYYDFFRWKNHYIVKEGEGVDICALCKYFNKPESLLSQGFQQSIRTWWYPDYRMLCKTHH